MTRTLLLLITSLGLALPILLALANLVRSISSLFTQRPLSFSASLYSRSSGQSYDLAPALHLSVTTSCLILLGSALLLFGLTRIRPDPPLPPRDHTSSSKP